MEAHDPEVAILLATYNGEPFIYEQLQSLTRNRTPFTLHWIDDHSTDSTPETVRLAAKNFDIALREWHHGKRQGLPTVFFHLLECVEADIYFFCDQDDVWQPGKIDATVAGLLPELESPVLCFSDAIVFDNDSPHVHLGRLSEVMHRKPPLKRQEARLLMGNMAAGHTMGFTRPLRQVFLRHKAVARKHAFMHDWWMYLVAIASGRARVLPDAPTSLYRLHEKGRMGKHLRVSARRAGGRTLTGWQEAQAARLMLARNAKGFIQASETFVSSPRLHRLLKVAHIISQLDRRQSPWELMQLASRGAFWPNPTWAFWLAITCILSHAGSKNAVATHGARGVSGI